eukprot:2741136-Prorocentrum_lima.AAC.1
MWKKTQGWRFYCEVDWAVLEKEGQKDQSDKNPVTVWYRGASMVMEMQMHDGKWEAFMADRFPE